MKVGMVVGTRPDIIKMSPVMIALRKKNVDFFIVHTGQHYSYELDKIFFEELNLPQPQYALGVKSIGPHRQGYHTGMIMIELEEVFLKELPDVVLVHGDTNSALAGALLTTKITTTKEYTGFNIRLGHIEAGLRSYDRSMPEEVNRVICDHLSDYLFAPTATSKLNMVKEGLQEDRMFVVGNTIVDAVQQQLSIARKTNIIQKLGLKEKSYILATVHRQENVDAKDKLRNILKGLVEIQKLAEVPLLYPLHPRTFKMMEKFGFAKPKEIMFIKPVGFHEFLSLEEGAKLAVTDSGGVQEESCILGVPCVTVRENTERPESLEINCNVLAGTDPRRMVEAAKKMLSRKPDWQNPFGDGTAGEKIVDILAEQVASSS